PRIAPRPRQRIDDVAQRRNANRQLRSRRLRIEGRQLLSQLRSDESVAVRFPRDPRDQLPGDRIALGMNPRFVQWFLAGANLEEPGRLRERRLADARNVAQLIAALERAILTAPFDDSPRGELVES